MKKENLFLIIGFLVMAIASILLLVIYQNFVPTTNLDKMFSTKVVLKNKTLVNDDNSGIIQSRSKAYTKTGNFIADLYEVRVFTTDFGDPTLPHLDLYIGIDNDEKIYVSDMTINQTTDFIPLIKDYIRSNYDGLYYENVQFIDGAAGATTIYDSRGAIKSAVTTVIEYHFGEEPLAVFYQSYDVSLEVDIEGGYKYPLNYKDQDLTIYKVTKEGTYQKPGVLETGTIEVFLAIDSEGLIKYVGLPTSSYNHSHGGFYNSINTDLSILVENSVNITSTQFNEFINATSIGVTSSRNLVNSILQIIGEDVNNESDN